MQDLTPEGLRLVAAAAERHGFSRDAAVALIGALPKAMGARRSSIIPISAAWGNGRRAE